MRRFKFNGNGAAKGTVTIRNWVRQHTARNRCRTRLTTRRTNPPKKGLLQKSDTSGFCSNPFCTVYAFFCQLSVVLRILVSSRRLYPIQPWFSPAPLRASIMVSIFASVLSAKLNASASKSAGFFGEPNSSALIHSPVSRETPESFESFPLSSPYR